MFFSTNKNNKEVLIEKDGFHSDRMKLFYLGKRIDTRKEQNIESDNEFGFIVTVKYTKEHISLTGGTLMRKVFNYNQVHYGCTEMGTVPPLTKIAFENDTHRCGFNNKIKDVDVVYIEIADKMYPRRYEEISK